MSVRTGDKIKCAFCNIMLVYLERYPHAICRNHYDECIDTDGNRVFYTNSDEFGGFVSQHMIGKKIVKKEDHDCTIQGVPCYADESRFGGIVIQVTR